jgi:molecular chaperone IbpA
MTLTLTSMPQMVTRYIGFEKLFEDLQTMTDSSSIDKYPPHNIIKINESQYFIELALSGFSKKEIEIILKENVLTITGQKKELTRDEVNNYLYRGIGTRSFTKKFQLSDTIVVCASSYIDGVLKIILENVIPESKKPRKIDIHSIEILPIKPQNKPQLLNESSPID